MKLKKGDNVIVIAGPDKGKKGTIMKTLREVDRVIVEGINMRKKHQRATTRGGKGQTIERATPLHASNVAILDPKSGKASRIGYDMKDGKKVRVAKKSGQKI